MHIDIEMWHIHHPEPTETVLLKHLTAKMSITHICEYFCKTFHFSIGKLNLILKTIDWRYLLWYLTSFISKYIFKYAHSVSLLTNKFTKRPKSCRNWSWDGVHYITVKNCSFFPRCSIYYQRDMIQTNSLLSFYLIIAANWEIPFLHFSFSNSKSIYPEKKKTQVGVSIRMFSPARNRKYNLLNK